MPFTTETVSKDTSLRLATPEELRKLTDYQLGPEWKAIWKKHIAELMNRSLNNRDAYAEQDQTPFPPERFVKELEWRRYEQEVDTLVDNLRMPIDQGIGFPVIALRANGFLTDGSCEGHLDHGLPYPWIDVVSPSVDKIRNGDRFSELGNSYRIESQGGPKMLREARAQLEDMEQTMADEIERLGQELTKEIKKFYEQTSGAAWSKESSLSIVEFGNGYRIQPTAGLPVGVDYENVKQEWSKRDLSKDLKEYRQQFYGFANYLKKRFIEEKSEQS